jgi:hypothetical protein
MELTTQQEISIRSIEPLTSVMLNYELPDGITLSTFLATECSVLVDGRFQVFTTKNCSFFTCMEENRLINEAHVQALMESFAKDGYLFTILYVNEKLQIIDGQHRQEAVKRSGLPVYFMVMPGWGIKEVTILNMNSRNWTVVDFMEAHAESGNPNYIRFKEFFDAHEFDVTVCQFIITGRRSRGYASSDEFRLGNTQIDDQLLTAAYVKSKKILEFKPFHPYGFKSRNFVEAMLALFTASGYEHDHMVAKLTTYPEMILIQARPLRVEEYLRIFTDKYNFRRMKDKIEVARR